MLDFEESEMTIGDKTFWFFRNLSATVLYIIVAPVIFLLSFVENIYGGVRATLRADGSMIFDYPWQIEWPLFRREDD